MELRSSQYVQNFVDSFMGIRGVKIDKSLERVIFRELSRLPEVETQIRDQWGNWEWPFSDSQREGNLYRPWIDELLIELRRNLWQEHPEWPWTPLWPEGRSFALCLTHDVDYVSQYNTLSTFSRYFKGSFARRREMIKHITVGFYYLTQKLVNRIRIDPLWHYEDWMKIESCYGFFSTFFFFPSHVDKRSIFDANYRYNDGIVFAHRSMKVKDMMRAIKNAGWDIGLHGSYYSATEPKMLVNQRFQIESVVEERVISIRQHWLHYDILQTPNLQKEAGLLCDSTQGFNRNIGFRAGTSFPYWCWDHTSQSPLFILEIPMHIMDGALFTTNALEYNREMAIQHCVQLMDRVAQVGGCLTLNWHPNYLNDDKWWSVYKTLLEEGAYRNAWGCSVKQLYTWWTQRERRLQSIPV